MFSFVCLATLLGLGYFIRRKSKLLQQLYLPASVFGIACGAVLIWTLILFIPKGAKHGQ
jgi:Na+/glutamate symporter